MVLSTRNSGLISDDDLLQKLKEGDDEAFRLLYKSYFPIALKYVLNNSGTDEEAKDVFQDVIIAFRENLYKGLILTTSLENYLRGIWQNNWLNKLRSKKKIENLGEEHYQIPIEENNEKYINDLEIKLNIAYKELGDTCRQILNMFYWKRFSTQVIAQELNLSNSVNAKKQKSRCLEKLRKIFDHDNR